MLKHLHIKDFAIIREINISFGRGMTVFTGETGAGKSIMVGALGAILGDRADHKTIRAGCKYTEITAIFEFEDNPAIMDIITEQQIEYEGELIMRRVINRDGRSRAYVNGSSVPTKLLRLLGENMLDIHGQHAHQSLLKAEIQRDILDNYGDYSQIYNTVNHAWQAWHTATLELKALHGETDNHDAQIALLRYQIKELEALNLDAVSFSRIEEEHGRLANVGHLLETCRQALEGLSDEEHSVHSRLNRHLHELQGIQQLDPSLTSIIELLNVSNIQLTEASDELRHYLDRLAIDPARLKDLTDQISLFHDISRKHNIAAEQLAEHQITLQHELDKLENQEANSKELLVQQQTALQHYQQGSEQLHQCRLQAALKLAEDISGRFNQLGMSGGQFIVDIKKLEADKPRQHGMDKIQYLVTLNRGQPLQPLSAVASGGELSRISLAIQMAASQYKGMATLIFDEVDSGIGGGVAEIVGELLHSLSASRQIFCITHLAQIAAQGDQHIKIAKTGDSDTTLTQINELSHKERIDEIARMLGGLKITTNTLVHAEEMLTAVAGD